MEFIAEAQFSSLLLICRMLNAKSTPSSDRKACNAPKFYQTQALKLRFVADFDQRRRRFVAFYILTNCLDNPRFCVRLVSIVQKTGIVNLLKSTIQSSMAPSLIPTFYCVRNAYDFILLSLSLRAPKSPEESLEVSSCRITN